MGDRIGFVGPGRVGGPMVERLLAVGRDVRVVARRPEVRERFAGLGAEAVGEVTALGACGVVVCCLFDDTQLAEVLPAVIEGLDPGALVISHTTGASRSPAGSRWSTPPSAAPLRTSGPGP